MFAPPDRGNHRDPSRSGSGRHAPNHHGATVHSHLRSDYLVRFLQDGLVKKSGFCHFEEQINERSSIISEISHCVRNDKTKFSRFSRTITLRKITSLTFQLQRNTPEFLHLGRQAVKSPRPAAKPTGCQCCRCRFDRFDRRLTRSRENPAALLATGYSTDNPTQLRRSRSLRTHVRPSRKQAVVNGSVFNKKGGLLDEKAPSLFVPPRKVFWLSPIRP